MSELTNSIAEAFRKRVVSASLGTYFFFWCTFHWQGIYTTLFTSQDQIHEKFGLLKNEYVDQYFFGLQGWSSAPGYILPLILTVAFIWLVPKYILIHAYRQEQRHKVDRRRVKIEEEERLQAKKEDLAIQTKKTIQAEIDTAQTEKIAAKQDPTIIWQKEYEAFKKGKLVRHLSDISEAVYTNGGRLRPEYDQTSGEWIGVELNKDDLAIAHTHGLIDLKNDRISLTDKGKYFIGQSYSDRLA